MNAPLSKDVLYRLTRIETKLVRGFEELGVNIDQDREWLSVDEENLVVYVSTLGRSMTVVLSDMERAGAKSVDKFYDIVNRGEVVGSICFKPIV
jgi:hypothetical protein